MSDVAKPPLELVAFLERYKPSLETATVDAPVYVAPGVSGFVLYREGQYQVECFTVQPNSFIPLHIHPNVDSFEVPICGDIVFACDGVIATQNIPVYVASTAQHGGVFGPRGGVFLSVQLWKNDITPHNIANDWADASGNSAFLGVASIRGDIK